MNPTQLSAPALVTRSFSLTSAANRFVAWTLLALLLTVCGTRAAGPDDDYVAIYILITRADNLNKTSDLSQAHAKYLEAQAALTAFQQANPHWNNQIVAFRLNFLAEKIAETNEKTIAAAAGESLVAKGDKSTSAAKSPVKLLAPGSEPRTLLRLHPSAGDKQTLTMTMKMGMDMAAAGQSTPAVDIPPIIVTMLVEVKEVAANGDIAYALTYDDATVAADTNALPAMIEAMKTSMSGIRGMTGTGKMSAQGIILAMQMKLPAAADPQLSQMMEQMKESFASSSTPFPAEAVGPGAKWEYRTKLKSQGMTIDQTITSELVALDGNNLTLHSTIFQNAANQKIQNPAMPGLKVDLTKMTGTGTGQSNYDLSRLLPLSATLEETTETIMSMNLGQQKQNMDMKMNVKVTIESK